MPAETPPRYQIPPGPAYQPPQRQTAIEPSGSAANLVKPDQVTGFLGMVLDVFKQYGPELFANAVTTRANFSEVGALVRTATRSPLSMAAAAAGGLVALLTGGKGTLGAGALVLAKGAAHATVAELARPKSPSPPTSISGTEGVLPADASAPTEV